MRYYCRAGQRAARDHNLTNSMEQKGWWGLTIYDYKASINHKSTTLIAFLQAFFLVVGFPTVMRNWRDHEHWSIQRHLYRFDPCRKNLRNCAVKLTPLINSLDNKFQALMSNPGLPRPSGFRLQTEWDLRTSLTKLNNTHHHFVSVVSGNNICPSQCYLHTVINSLFI